ncbi:MAG TPA: M56 family metallopeptidase [Pirellulales bacterium]|jgi:beta-lactamase regulating signal transducer with metallopeptidase domain|nr:M56 family metallopeptidase [Pirellulales bacterium]
MNTALLAVTPGWIDQRLWLAIGWTIVHFLWVGTAIGLSAWGLRSLLRWLGPQVRYVASILALMGLAVAPVVLFRWQLERIPPSTSASVTLGAASAPGHMAASPVAINFVSPPKAPSRSVSTADTLYAEANAWLSLVAEIVPWIWVTGAPVMYVLLGCGLVGAERLRRRSRRLVTGELDEICQRLRAALRIARPVAVAVSQRVIAPMLVGILKPLILLPAAMLDGQSVAQIEMILLHELAHVRRWDNLVNLAQRMVEAALFFHPAVWFVSRWVRLEREHCCDAVVLAHTDDPRAYAETLAALAIPGMKPAHAAAVMANHQLLARIRHILNLEDRRMTLSVRFLTVMGSLVVTAALLVIARAQSTAADLNPDAKSADSSTQKTLIDEATKEKLAAHRLAADKTIDDAEFLRRLTLDATGSVPTPEEITLFAADTSPDKRAKRVQQLFAQGRLSERNITKSNELLADDKLYSGTTFVIANGNTITAAGKRPWGPEQATGAPDSNMGDDAPTAWASLTPDGQEEWLELSYADPVDTVAVLVYENLAPGALTQVVLHSADQPGLSFTWTGADPTNPTQRSGISVIPLRVPMKTQRVKLMIDSRKVPGWNEIDAVGLLDRQGQVHWATSAQASSTYADEAINAQWVGSVDGTLVNQSRTDVDLEISAPRRDESPSKQPWSAAQATGAPDAPIGTDSGNAWASQNPDGGEEWLKLEYAAPVKAVAILIYESFNPGAVRDVTCYDSAGHEFSALAGRKPDSATKSGILSVPLSDQREVSAVKLTLDTAAVPGWNEIDAVGILDAEGKIHWAKSATASSSYVEPIAVLNISEPVDNQGKSAWWNDQVHQSNCLSCHSNAHQRGAAAQTRMESEPQRYRTRIEELHSNGSADTARSENELERYRVRMEELRKGIDELSREQNDLLREIHKHRESEHPRTTPE